LNKSQSSKHFSIIPPGTKCYVEEHQRALDTFVLESHKVLKSVNAKIRKFIKNKQVCEVTRENIKKWRESTKYKYSSGRNVLGVRVLLEDWIHGLEIGHVMQLNPMLATELQNPSSKINHKENLARLHELMKDPMLEKLVLLIVSMISIATELRLQNINTGQPWHLHSVICAAYYLPKECPLVEHLIESYFKHYPSSSTTT